MQPACRQVKAWGWRIVAAVLCAALLGAAVRAEEEPLEFDPVEKPPVQKVERRKVPAAADLEAALAKVKAVFEAEYAAATTDVKKQALARTLLEQAAKTSKDSAGQFVLLRQAEDQAVAAGDWELALSAADELCAAFVVVPCVEKAEVFKKASRLTTLAKPEEAVKLALQTVDDAVAAERFDIGKDLIRSATALAKLKRDPTLTRDISARNRDLILAEKHWDAATKAAAAIKQNPTDKNNYQVLGKYRCLVQGKWDVGLPLLIKGPFTPLRKAAEQDLAKPQDPALQTQLADAWLKLAEAATGSERTRLLDRAKLWYERALPELIDLDKVRVEKQLEKIAQAAEAGPAPVKGKGKDRDHLDVSLGSGVTLRLRMIPRGQLVLGDSGKTLAVPRGFYLGVTEVTQAQWQAVMGTNPAANKADPRLPVESMTFAECEEFVKRLNGSKLGKLRFRLPTETEWEYACRAGTTTTYSFGADERMLTDYEWFKANSASRTQIVAQKKPNAAGLYDMQGNVCEFCQGNVMRGACVGSEGRDATPAYRQDRNGQPPRHNQIGLRLACDPL